jgi:hypothetical protein
MPSLSARTAGGRDRGNVSGVLVPRWDEDDRIKFAVNAGLGIGRYIADLSSLGGQDAVYDSVQVILLSPELFKRVESAEVFRKGVWAGKNGDKFEHFPDMTKPRSADGSRAPGSRSRASGAAGSTR